MNKVIRTLTIGLAVVAALFCAVSPAHATTATYTESATASGTLDGTSFTDALVTITLTGDTSTVTSTALVGPPWPSGLIEDAGTATVTVSGVGTDTFTDSMYVFDTASAEAVGITDGTLKYDALDTYDPAFATYGLTTSIGPITDSDAINPGHPFNTEGGTLVLDSVPSFESTFTATVATPEPGSLLLLGMGFAGLLGIRKNQR